MTITRQDAIERLMSLQSVASTVQTSEKEAKSQQQPIRNSNVAVTRTYLQRLGVTVRDR